MRILIILLLTVAAVKAQGAYEEKYQPKPYVFNYLAEGEEGSSSHQEESDGTGNVRGSYSLKDADGRERVVEYVAGKEGFVATVITNEPGTENKNPADVIMKSSAENKNPADVIMKSSAENKNPADVIMKSSAENKNPADVIMKSSAENVGAVPGTAALRTESRLAHPGPQRNPQPRDRMFLVPIEKQ